jgi:hypothetical protein
MARETPIMAAGRTRQTNFGSCNGVSFRFADLLTSSAASTSGIWDRRHDSSPAAVFFLDIIEILGHVGVHDACSIVEIFGWVVIVVVVGRMFRVVLF